MHCLVFVFVFVLIFVFVMHGMVWYGMVWYGMVWCGAVWYGMVWYGMYVCRQVGPCLPTQLYSTELQVGLRTSYTQTLNMRVY